MIAANTTRGQLLRMSGIFGIYMGASILNKALPFFLLPVMTKYLSPAEYGLVALYQALIAFALPFIGMNMSNNLTRRYFREDADSIARLMSNLLAIVSAAAILVLLLLWAYLQVRPGLMDIPQRWVLCIPLIAAMQAINILNLTILRNEQKALTYGLFEVGSTVLNAAVTLALVIGYSWGWEGPVMGTLAASFAFGVIGLVSMRRHRALKFDIDPGKIKEELKICLPLIAYSLSGVIIFISDRIFLYKLWGKAELGVYSVGYSLAMVMALFTNAFNKTWSPWLYKKLADNTPEGNLSVVRYTYLYQASLLVLSVVATYAIYLILPLMVDERYYGVAAFVGWIVFANAINGMYGVLVPFSVHEGKTNNLAVIMSLAAVTNLVGNYYLIEPLGALGAAQSTLLAYCVGYLLNFIVVARMTSLPWFELKVLRPSLKAAV